MTIYRLGFNSYQAHRRLGLQVGMIRTIKYSFSAENFLFSATTPPVSGDGRSFSTSNVVQKTRKQIKNKNLKKDPTFRPCDIRIDSHTNKYMNKHKSKKTRDIELWNGITLEEFSQQLEADVDDVMDVILSLKDVDTDSIETEKSEINRDLWPILSEKLNFSYRRINPTKKKEEKVLIDKDVYKDPPADEHDLIGRPPVITIMGHIDHGKTSLLDHLRKSRIVAGEHGGITQHIGAFTVSLDSGSRLTFIDTPGHAAFTAMRTRGASSTDIVILIVDACEGVLEQTVESIRIIRQTRVPFIVAINKIDKEGANIEKTKKELIEEGVRLEETGGDVQCVPISAVKGTNIKQLMEAILTQAEILELKCDLKGRAEAVIIESQIEQGLGKTASILLQRGVLTPGAFLVAGNSWCKIRLMMDDRGTKLKKLTLVAQNDPKIKSVFKDHLGSHVVNIYNKILPDISK